MERTIWPAFSLPLWAATLPSATSFIRTAGPSCNRTTSMLIRYHILHAHVYIRLHAGTHCLSPVRLWYTHTHRNYCSERRFHSPMYVHIHPSTFKAGSDIYRSSLRWPRIGIQHCQARTTKPQPKKPHRRDAPNRHAASRTHLAVAATMEREPQTAHRLRERNALGGIGGLHFRLEDNLRCICCEVSQGCAVDGH